jgi:UDP-N-acetylmuramoyl-tripeptide--D-alanyl-D-alanine ligase
VTAVTKHLLQQAVERRRKLTFPFIGITGSNGKTTVKRMLKTILSRCGRVYDFSDYSDTALPIAEELLAITAPYDWALVKFGANAPDQVKLSAELIKPHIGVITNIGEAHLARHGTVENISASKAELFKAVDPEGIAVLNRDNDYTKALGEQLSFIKRFFGLSELADFFAADIDFLGPDGAALTVHRKNRPSLRLHIPIYSMGDVYNALAAIAVADALHIPEQAICASLEHDFQLPDGRGRLYRPADLLLFDDTYDATPQSLLKSTRSLLQCKKYSKRLVLILGDMTELGGQTDHYQKMIGHYLSGMPIDLIILVGQYAALTAQAITGQKSNTIVIHECTSVDQVIRYLLQEIKPGDAIMVEGGHDLDMSRIVTAVRENFTSLDKPAPILQG